MGIVLSSVSRQLIIEKWSLMGRLGAPSTRKFDGPGARFKFLFLGAPKSVEGRRQSWAPH